MSDEMCPCCGGQEIGFEDYGVEVWPAQYECEDCYYSWQGGNGAYFAPSGTPPTEAEKQAHADLWGEGAGWTVSVLDIRGRWMISDSELASAQGLAAVQAHEIRWWPHVNGRPVGWPTVEGGA